MTVFGLRRHVPHGVAGLLVVLFALAGLTFGYGLGHPPPVSLCLAHDLGGAAPANPGQQAGPPLDLPHPGPQDACLSLAVLLTLMVLGLAAVPRRWGTRPKRSGWYLTPPRAPWAPLPRSLAVLQVLRL